MLREIGSFTIQYITPKILDGGEVKIAVMKYTKIDADNSGRSWTTIRLPAETGKPGERFIETYHRGLIEEIAASKATFNAKMLGYCHAQLGDDEKRPELFHAKIAIIVLHQRGEFRADEKVDEDDADEIHGPIVFVEARKLLEHGMGGCKLLLSHGISICAYLRRLAGADANVANRYCRILEQDTYRGQRLSDQEENQVRELIAKN